LAGGAAKVRDFHPGYMPRQSASRDQFNSHHRPVSLISHVPPLSLLELLEVNVKL
jgi:hypothetical protein